MSRSMRIRAAGFLVAALFLLPGAGGEAQSVKEARKPKTGTVTGIVVRSDTGAPVGGATVRVQKLAAQADSSGKFRLDNVPVGNWVVTSDVMVPEGGFLGFFAKEFRYWGFAADWVEEGKETVVKVAVRRHGDVENTCRGCHPEQPARNFPVRKCLHPSGRELKSSMAEQAKRYNVANEKAKKEQKPHFPPIDLEELKRPDGSVYHVYDCESCHTVHAPTPYRRYIKAPYVERSVLCEGCH